MRNRVLQFVLFLSFIAFTQYAKAGEKEGLLNDDPERHYAAALRLRKSGNYEDAIRSLTEALKLKPNYAQAQFEFGSIYEFHVENATQDAVKWYTLSAANGHKDAGAAISRALGNKKGAAAIRPISDDKKKN